MVDHFAAFSFVDRITELEPGKRARGTFAIPAGIDAFPPCLMAEAVGQLAAWVAMSRIEFRGRPVAALANETRFLRAAKPGDVLELEVEIHDVDDEAVAYQGHADIDGVLIPFDGPALEWGDWVRHPERSDLVVSREMVGAIEGLGADIVWLSSWAANANAIVSPFVGWPARLTLEKRTGRAWWKVDAVASFLVDVPYARVAWLDDDFDRYEDEVRDRVGRSVSSGRLRLIRPDRGTGLSRRDLEEVRTWFGAGAA